MMQDLQRHKDVVFESQKLNFALNAVDPGEAQPSQPWLEVAPEQDEKGTPGLQVVPQEHQKYMARGLHEALALYRTPGSAHADELTSQGIQAVPIQSMSQMPPQSQDQAQFQWAIPVPNQHYVQSAQESSLEVVPQASLHDAQQFGVWNSETHPLQAPPPLNFDPSWAKDEAHMIAAAKTKRKRRKRWVIGGIIVVVIIGVVLGAVLGTTARRSSGSGKTTSNESSPTTIKGHSKIAVTGYRLDSGDGDDYAIRIFFQDPQDRLRFVSKESTSDNWTDSTILDTLPYAPKKDGAIAASSYMDSGTKPILELFYEDEDSMVRGHMFNFALENGTLPLKGQSSSLNDYPLEMAAGTRISSFFPYVATQDADNKVRWTVMYGMNGSNPASPWWVNDTDLGIEASTGSGLVSLPAAQDYTDASGVVYRSTDGKLSCKLRNASAESAQGTSWTYGTLAQDIAANTSIGGFTVGRPYDSNNQVNTYILYQDDDGAIQVVCQVDSSGWQGPQTFEALVGAMEGTDIACLTPGAFPRRAQGISREQDMNRCFFQVDGGRVKEVWYDGSSWVDVGIVPIA